MPRFRPVFILESIQTVFSNGNDTLKKELNLDFSPEVSPEKRVIFSVETPKIYQEINATLIMHKATDFSAQLVAVKTPFMSEIYELKREIIRLRKSIIKGNKIQLIIICIKNTKSKTII